VRDGEGASLAAPCLPTTSKNSVASTKPHDMFSRCPYINLKSRLPHNTASLEGVVWHAGADTRLKSIASQNVMNLPPRNNGENSDEGKESDGNASVSLEERLSSLIILASPTL
jgi:hypothetical protein